MKPLKVTLAWKFLERIAEYYEFPSAVFLGNRKMFKEKTRKESLRKVFHNFKMRMTALIDEFFPF
mgnify:FL=1